MIWMSKIITLENRMRKDRNLRKLRKLSNKLKYKKQAECFINSNKNRITSLGLQFPIEMIKLSLILACKRNKCLKNNQNQLSDNRSKRFQGKSRCQGQGKKKKRKKRKNKRNKKNKKKKRRRKIKKKSREDLSQRMRAEAGVDLILPEIKRSINKNQSRSKSKNKKYFERSSKDRYIKERSRELISLAVL